MTELMAMTELAAYLQGERRQVHCIGIAGSGMAALARLLHLMGHDVSGSDMRQTAQTVALQSLGVTVYQGHNSCHVEGTGCVVYSSAVGSDNIERRVAQTNGAIVVPRGLCLAALLQCADQRIAVVGTHGKTSTTSILAQCLPESMQAGYYIGGELVANDLSSYWAGGRLMVSELDESDRSFLFCHPSCVVITNIDADHMQAYNGSLACLSDAFLSFIHQLPQDGVAILSGDCPNIQRLLPSVERRVLTFGYSDGVDYQVVSVCYQGASSVYTVHGPNGRSWSVKQSLPGKHNILNALPSIVVSDYWAQPVEQTLQAIAAFQGVRRRFESHGQIELADGGLVEVYEDYGHHPAAISAIIRTVKEAWQDARCVMVFQPHRYSRSRDAWDEFVRVLSSLPLVLVCDTYAAGEAALPDYESTVLTEAINAQGGRAIYCAHADAIWPTLAQHVVANDVLVFQGAGSVGEWARACADQMRCTDACSG